MYTRGRTREGCNAIRPRDSRYLRENSGNGINGSPVLATFRRPAAESPLEDPHDAASERSGELDNGC
jgi:hypothetical protein